MSDDTSYEVELRRRSMPEQITYLLTLVASLQERVKKLEGRSKGGRPAKTIQVKAEGVCGIDPSIDSAVCPYASLYRRRQGCAGDACVKASSDYYKSVVRDA